MADARNPPDIEQLITDAAAGDPEALRQLLGQAGAWRRAGKRPPKQLGQWTAELLTRLSKEVMPRKGETTEDHDARIAKAVGTHRADTGRHASKAVARQQKRLHRDVVETMRKDGIKSPTKAFKVVADWHSQNNGERSGNDPRNTVPVATVKSAYYAIEKKLKPKPLRNTPH